MRLEAIPCAILKHVAQPTMMGVTEVESRPGYLGFNTERPIDDVEHGLEIKIPVKVVMSQRLPCVVHEFHLTRESIVDTVYATPLYVKVEEGLSASECCFP